MCGVLFTSVHYAHRGRCACMAATMRNTTLSRRQGGHAAVAHAVAAQGRCVSCCSAAAVAPSALERPAPAAERVNTYARDWCRSVLQRVAAHTPQQQQQEHQHAGRTHATLQLLDELYEQLEETFCRFCRSWQRHPGTCVAMAMWLTHAALVCVCWLRLPPRLPHSKARASSSGCNRRQCHVWRGHA